MSILNQSKVPGWLGALQVQMSNANYYIVYYSQAMMIGTFWFTAGSPTAEKYASWLSFWVFVGILVSSLIVLLFLDYKFMLPSRQRFLNAQSCKHENPAMDAILDIQKRMQRIEKKLGIEE